MIDLDRIDEYCRKATEGPWVERSAPHPDGDISKGEYMTSCLEDFLTSLMLVIPECDDAPTVDKYRVVSITGDGPTSVSNAYFIAQARTDLPAVVAELREAREILREGQELMAILHPDSSDKPLEAGCIYNEWLSKVRKFLGVTE